MDPIEELLTRGVTEVIDKDRLKARLLSGEKLRVKLGIDPTSPDIHIGRAIPLLKLRDFQKQGHKVVFIIGDFTSVIGDTSDKESERPMLTKEEVERNQKTYFEQAGKLIDLEQTELRRNSEWLEPLTFREIGEQANLFSVADFIARENIAKRLSQGKRVSLREVLYPLMQGYDSVAVKADIELGGTDQRFNLLAGRTMQIKYGQRPQDIILNPLIPGLDGRKMSSSWDNTISLTSAPNDMYGKVMSMADENVKEYFEFCTRVPMEEIEKITKEHPKEAKMKLAWEIVALYHSKDAAEKAQKNFVETFSKKGIPTDTEIIKASVGTNLADLLIESGLIDSKTEWRRLVEDGAVTNLEAQEKITSSDAKFTVPTTLKIGKHRFLKIEVL